MLFRATLLSYTLILLFAVAGAVPASSPAPQSSPTTIPSACAGCMLAGMALEHADFSGAIYVGTNFEGADLREASFRGAKLVAVNFRNADLSGAAFDGAECTACNFLGAKFDGATFSGVRIVAANFAGFAASIDNAQARALLSGCFACNFSKSNFSGRDLSKLPLVQVDFSQADLRGANLDGAILCRYSVNGTQRAIVCDNLKDAQTAGASFRNIQLCENALQQTGCTTIDPQTLQRYSQPAPSPSASPQ
jgi:uncharacterized protein YjbI with pentapeptide repeats